MFYNGARGVLHARAIGELQSCIYQEGEPLRVAAVPEAANPLSWHGIVETQDFYALADANLAGTFDPGRARIVHKIQPDSAINAAKRTETFQVFLRFSEFPEWSVSPGEERENSKVASVTDMRFMGFAANALEDANGRVLRTWLEIGGIPTTMNGAT